MLTCSLGRSSIRTAMTSRQYRRSYRYARRILAACQRQRPRKSRLAAHREALLVSRLRVQLIGSYCSRRDSTNWASREMLRHWSQRARQRQRQQSLSLHTDRYIQHSVSMQASPPLFLHSLRSRTESPHAWQFATIVCRKLVSRPPAA